MLEGAPVRAPKFGSADGDVAAGEGGFALGDTIGPVWGAGVGPVLVVQTGLVAAS